jgi:hypothetical protein
MPIGAKTITPTVPNPKEKPGEESEGHGYKVEFTGFFPNPTRTVKKRENPMKNQEEIVKEKQHS